MKRQDKKSNCAINYALETIGDPWSLLIIRDMVNFGKKTYGEFLASDERIGTSVLAHKLTELEHQEIIRKQPGAIDKRKAEYYLTKKGINFVPLLNELAVWGTTYDEHTAANKTAIAKYQADRQGVIDRTKRVLREYGTVLQNFDYIYANK